MHQQRTNKGAEHMKLKLKWTVSAPPTGLFRSFFERGWPSAELDGNPAALLRCADAYLPRRVKEGNHAPIKVWIAVWRKTRDGRDTFDWRSLKGEYATVADAKASATRFLTANPQGPST